ncbi:MoxR family ATPase [Acidaminobacter sp. JC074]|uniref:AAA family ATPase n=1 Tax=Acidaminobacter sp. JC074 TaxID=2530199 RepID=UPI001F113153|nr:MoxR family ATPase [Acidaminobacter sp. JC074]MCH4886049.1 MoxR family ATPase [Acidaminobacter sp. JC074]
MEVLEKNDALLKIERLKKEVGKVIIGQEYMVDRILIGLLTGGHILLEGIPGLAKTLTASTTADVLGIDFSRIQFTPDLLPADIIGTEIYHQKTGDFLVKKGAIFSNIVLADEINRAPAKVQSALLEAMQEKQVTIGDETHMLNKPFVVIATQNPLEQQGTYPLPEAQQDRFMLKLKVEYPTKEEERAIIDRFTDNGYETPSLETILSGEEIIELRSQIDQIYVDDVIKDYILDIIFQTRQASTYIACGASPRASLNLIKASKARAFLMGRDHVRPDDVKAMVYDVLRHRISLTYEAEADDMTVEQIISHTLDSVKLP